jgi:hypothetical protein
MRKNNRRSHSTEVVDKSVTDLSSSAEDCSCLAGERGSSASTGSDERVMLLSALAHRSCSTSQKGRSTHSIYNLLLSARILNTSAKATGIG